MDPPLSNNEVQQLIKSVNRKGYDKYRCKDAPINSVCQSGLCRTKRFGVGFGEEEMPVLGSLTKYTSNPPQWFLNVDKTRIELKSEQLYNPGMFALACLDQANKIVPVPKPKDWKQHFLKPMMSNLQEVEPLESLDPINELTGLFKTGQLIDNQQELKMIYLINYHTQKMALHILEWKTFIILEKE